jgi:hypothetical protein
MVNKIFVSTDTDAYSLEMHSQWVGWIDFLTFFNIINWCLHEMNRYILYDNEYNLIINIYFYEHFV